MSTFSSSIASRMAFREIRSSLGTFIFAMLSIAAGVAALTGVRAFSSSFRATLLERSRSIMAADVSAHTAQQPTLDQLYGLNEFGYQGIRMTPVTEMLSAASAAGTVKPQLVTVKAVDPTVYPLYGSVELKPEGKLSSVLTADTIVVAEELTTRLQLHIGDQLKIGGKLFSIAGIVVNEPDRLSGELAAAPRVLMSRQGLTESGLLISGSHADQRYLFKFPVRAGDEPQGEASLASFKARLAKVLPDAQITDYRETNPELTAGLDQATSVLSLISLIALVLAAVGVAMAMRAHLSQQMETIAILRSLGAVSSQIIKIHLAQTLALGVAGSLLGVGLGVLVQLVFPALLGNLVNLRPEFHFEPSAMITGLLAGVGTTVLFTLPPLLEVRNVNPSLILRRGVDAASEPFRAGLLRRFRSSGPQVAGMALALVSLAVLAARISNSSQVGRWFALGLAAILVVLLLVSFVVLRTIKFLLSHTRFQLPSSMRHGLANIYRPGNPSGVLLAALGIGVAEIMLVFLTQHAVTQRLYVNADSGLPNLFLTDIASDQIDGMRILLQSTPAVTSAPELLPVVSSQILGIDGVRAGHVRTENISLTFMNRIPAGASVVEGSWWTKQQLAEALGHPVVAVAEKRAERLGIHPGSKILFATQTRNFEAEVVGFTTSDGQHAYSQADFILPQALLGDQPAVWYGGVHVEPSGMAALQRDLYNVYPTVTVVDVAQALESIRSIVIQAIRIVRFMAAFSIFAGLIILAASIAGTRFSRIREIVVLKMLGASRSRVVTVFSVEFAVLGMVAGVVGVTFASILVFFLLRALGVPSRVEWVWSVAGVLLTICLTVGTGWFASLRVLGQKPLEILRED